VAGINKNTTILRHSFKQCKPTLVTLWKLNQRWILSTTQNKNIVTGNVKTTCPDPPGVCKESDTR
jgi:hypothetical protein